jgi:hypothetical protein
MAISNETFESYRMQQELKEKNVEKEFISNAEKIIDVNKIGLLSSKDEVISLLENKIKSSDSDIDYHKEKMLELVYLKTIYQNELSKINDK